ncbi:unnamed protein product [Vitrella brassicaformis CCMP3155]|uniref:Uncharacterized protein n=1 Tax=Vitrella brassicaformis (strain CCMP3155) TaxID=1169540 RepID=A0A0G4G5A5_VITBC|nr:unnamed protein product [Vitrella brassicaformis CCMP3155]|eukprot:CEM23724.1 unnamed protein product [Vitrella brassicaformis CCMP3155]
MTAAAVRSRKSLECFEMLLCDRRSCSAPHQTPRSSSAPAAGGEEWRRAERERDLRRKSQTCLVFAHVSQPSCPSVHLAVGSRGREDRSFWQRVQLDLVTELAKRLT